MQAGVLSGLLRVPDTEVSGSIAVGSVGELGFGATNLPGPCTILAGF